ncbi:MAG: ABC transporter permease subunit [Cyanobacteriota bacterium]
MGHGPLSPLCLVAIWKQVSFFMVMYLAGLQSLSQDVYEAADLDGANHW